MVGGATVATGVRAVVVTGADLLVTGRTGDGAADVVGAVAIWVVTGGDSCVVAAGPVGVVASLTGGGGGGNADRLGWVGDTVVGVGDTKVDVGVGAVPLTTSGVTGVSLCRGPPNVSSRAPVSKASGTMTSSRAALRFSLCLRPR